MTITNTNITNIFKGFSLILFLFIAQIAAQEQNDKLPPSIQTSGEATVMTTPDRAQIDVGVVTRADTSQTAVEQNAQKLQTTLTRLKQLLGTDAFIKTISYSVSPDYRYPKEGGEPTITGYTATNILRVTIDDLTQIGKVIDMATQAGSNRIQNLQFTLKDERKVKEQALRDAAVKAREKAETLASALNLKVVRILSVVESSPTVIPVRNVAFARTEAASTPIEPGTIEVRANVTFIVEVNQ